MLGAERPVSSLGGGPDPATVQLSRPSTRAQSVSRDGVCPVTQLLWQQRQDIGPTARREPAMVYMTSRARTFLFGGYAASTWFGDTWEWDGESWVQVADMGPSPRRTARSAYDTGRDVVVLYGGKDAIDLDSLDFEEDDLFDTWEWDGQEWAQIEDIGPKPPTPSMFVEVVYDSARQVTLLEGGAVATGGVGTWTWDGAAWTQIEDTGPPQRSFGALAFDPVRERAVLFGGAAAGDPTGTWEWDGSVWKHVEDIGPSTRFGHSMTWDGSTVLLFGGFPTQAPPKALRDTWTWDGNHWIQRQDIGPSPRGDCGVAWDEARDRIVLFGGQSSQGGGTYFGDTWEAFEKPAPA